MSARGSQYACKHLSKMENKPAEKSAADTFLDVIYDDITYLQTFDALSLDDQVKAYRVLKKLSEVESKCLAEQKLADISLYKLQRINTRAGLGIVERLRYSLTSDELHLIRMDCYGCVSVRRSHLLSRFYTHFSQKKLLKSLPPESYDLDKAPTWKIFRQFKSFRSIEDALKEFLAHQRYRPEMLEVLGVQDFSDLIFQTFRKSPKDKKAVFAPSSRNEFVKALAIKKGDEIENIMKKANVDERYIHSLLNAMKLFGITDSSRIIATELYFTERVLKDLKRAKIPCDTFQVGDPIPQDLHNKLMMKDKGLLLVARDETGAILDKSNFPSFEVHHKIAVSESGRLGLVASVNYRRNYLLVSSDLHANVLHAYDKILKTNISETYQRRLEFENSTATFMFGFTKDQQIMFEWPKTREDRKLEAKDKKYAVSYYEAMAELENNRAKYKNKKSKTLDVDKIVDIVRRKQKERRAK